MRGVLGVHPDVFATSLERGSCPRSLRSHLDLRIELFARRPADEPLLVSMRLVVNETVGDYSADPDQELARLRLVTTTPVLEAGLGRVFAGFERLVRRFTAAHANTDEDARGPRLIAAAAVTAFRVGLELWVATDASSDLAGLIIGNLDELTAGIPRALTTQLPRACEQCSRKAECRRANTHIAESRASRLAPHTAA